MCSVSSLFVVVPSSSAAFVQAKINSVEERGADELMCGTGGTGKGA